LEKIHIDLSGKIKIDLHGNAYFMIIVDEFTRASWVYLLRRKDEALTHLMQWKIYAKKQYNSNLLNIYMDGGELNSKNTKEFWTKQGIAFTFTQPYSSEMNGLSKRVI